MDMCEMNECSEQCHLSQYLHSQHLRDGECEYVDPVTSHVCVCVRERETGHSVS